MRLRWSLPGVGLIVLSATVAAMPEKTAKEREDFFVQRVAPIFRLRCLECHGAGKARGSLDLSSRAALLEGGDKGPAIVPGNVKASLLLQMVQGTKPKMPQKSSPLTLQEVVDLTAWIEEGAHWPQNLTLAPPAKKADAEAAWALQPLVRPAIPVVQDSAWAREAIDRFVRAMLDKKGMKPNNPTDRLTFIRRVTYDLHGLPPTPEEIAQFIEDTAPDAFEKLVDRLLASPRYGERWGRHWLDVVHYADTHGYDKDKRRLWAWLFRDWVIRAFNQDMPYRRFVRMQLAGDVLFPSNPDGIIATGFVVAGPWDFVGQVELREGTIAKEKTRVLDRDDMVANTMSTFCSMTVHCARCHDHKFDPIPQKDYYRLQAVFAGVERGDRPIPLQEVVTQRKVLEQKRQALGAQQSELLHAVQQMATPQVVEIDAKIKEVRRQLDALSARAGLKNSPTNGYHSLISSTPDVTKWVQIDLGQSVPLDAVRLIPARPTDFRDAPGFGFPLRFMLALSDDAAFTKFETLADHTQADFANPGDQPLVLAAQAKKARYVRLTATRLWKRSNDYVFALAELQALSAGSNRALGAKVSALDSIEGGRWSKKNLIDNYDSRKSLADLSDPQTQQRFALEASLQKWEQARTMQVDAILGKQKRGQLQRIDQELSSLAKQIAVLQNSAKIYAVLPIKPRPIHVLTRGDVERKGKLSLPGSLSLLADLERHFHAIKADEEGQRRAALAEWIVDERNVLTWRSIANRIWHYHFGRGLVDTPNDFGKNGSRPTHPALLDWLACELRDGASFKHMHRRIVLSQTYRQSSQHQPQYARQDGDNRYLWRMNRQRLDAESLRDSVLAVSGKLDLKMYGPGFELFRFKDDHSPVYDHQDLHFANRPESWRRTVYRFVVRSVPNPFLESLDCADPNINVPVRNTTLTALQALSLLNHPFMVQQASFFAERVRKQSPAEPARQVESAYRLAFGRPPTHAENEAMTAYVQRYGLANACRFLFNANEFMFVD